MQKNIFFTTLIAVAIGFQAVNATKVLAVLEIVPKDNVNEISVDEVRHLTDDLRKQATKVLPKQGFSILTRDNILALIPPDEKEAECLAESCAVDIGRVIGAEYVTSGSIGKFGKKFSISVELYETMSGRLLSSIVMESEDINGLLAVIRKEGAALFEEIKADMSPLSQNQNSQNFETPSRATEQPQAGNLQNNKNSKSNIQNEETQKDDNQRISIYLHPGTLILSSAKLVIADLTGYYLYLTGEFPINRYTSIIVEPSFWANNDPGEGDVDELDSSYLYRIGSGIGVRFFVNGKADGLYFQFMPSLYYVEEGSENGYWVDFFGYIGYSLKFSKVSIFADIGVGYVNTRMSDSKATEHENGLLPNLNLGVGIPF